MNRLRYGSTRQAAVGASATMYAEEKLALGSSRCAGIALRYGFFYGPGTWYWTEGAVAKLVKRQKSPVIEGAAAPCVPLFTLRTLPLRP